MIKRIKYLDLEFNKITNQIYENIIRDNEMSEDQHYEKTNVPIDVDNNIIRNVSDPEQDSDAVNKKTLDKVKTDSEEVINKINERIDDLIVVDKNTGDVSIKKS